MCATSRDCGQVQLGQAGEERRRESIGEGFLKLFREETARIYGSFCERSCNVGLEVLLVWKAGFQARDAPPWKK